MSSELRFFLLSVALIILCMEIFCLAGSGSGSAYALWGNESGGANALWGTGSSESLSETFPRGPFVLSFALFFLLISFIKSIFELFVSSRAASFLSLLPAALLVLLLHRTVSLPFLAPAIVAAAVLRLLSGLLIRRDRVIRQELQSQRDPLNQQNLLLRQNLILHVLTFLLDITALFLYLSQNILTGQNITDKLLFISLTVLTLSALQQILIERGGAAFPLQYFALMGVLLLLLPMKPEPINWKPVINAGARAVRKVVDLADGATYFLSSAFDGGTYTAGYSSLGETGGAIAESGRTELILHTSDKPYFTYTDAESSTKMQVRRTLYLVGGRGADTGQLVGERSTDGEQLANRRGADAKQLVRFLRFLHASGVDHAHAAVFSRLSQIRVEYAYLDTMDEIAPAGSFLLFSEEKGGGVGANSNASDSEKSTAPARHRKGYTIDAQYLDIDYGSPYLIRLIKAAGKSSAKGAPLSNAGKSSAQGNNPSNESTSSLQTDLSYEEACDYARELYGIELGDILTQEEFEESADERLEMSLYTDVSGAGGKLKELAEELAGGDWDDYDKCRRIEAYLRQYSYDVRADGASGPKSDMRTSEGLTDLADRFLFETGAGYCVHYTASMVMLLRLAGIPARAVSGYRYVFPFEKQDSYAVAGSCAHVWPEAYLESVGWVPFEPTAAYRTTADNTWHKEAPSTGADSASATASGLYDEYGGYGSFGEFGEFAGEGASIPAAALAGENDDDSEAMPMHPVEQFMRIAGPVVLSILVLLVLLFAGSRLIVLVRYRLASPEKKLIMDVEMIRKCLRRQAPDGFVDRGILSDYISLVPEDLIDDVQSVFHTYYRVIYGNQDTSDGQASVTPQENELARRVAELLS